MTTIEPQRVTLTIPAGYLQDARTATIADIHGSADALARFADEERPSSACILSRELRLLEQLLATDDDTTVEAEQDQTSSPISQMLEEMVRLLSKRLAEICVFGPVPMGEVAAIAERLRWAAEKAVRLCPSLDHMLSADEHSKIEAELRRAAVA